MVDGGASINLLFYRLSVKMGKTEKDLIPMRLTVTNFAGGITTTHVILDVDVIVGTKKLKIAFFVVDTTSTTYNALLGRDWIHQSLRSIGSLLVQENKEVKERPVYYLSRTLIEVERKYSVIERLCLALYFTARKLRHYMLPFTIYIIAKTDFIKYMMTRSMRRGKIFKWTLALSEFVFRYVPQKAIKGQAVSDFLADLPGEEIENMDSMDIANVDLLCRAHTYLNNPLYSVHLTPWKLYFDGSKTDLASDTGIVLKDPLGIKHCYSFQLDFLCTNNRVEYEALIIGLEMLIELGVQYVEIQGDYVLVLKQITGEYKCLNPSLVVYFVAARNLLVEFREATW
ncbi:uncharacterized protein LOC117625599 [Prunus dulcis]|uniref:uncharacterized protein LOC117625599 n=1 Tax=Prunus dulcis TaxID=3755 RepID=UPI00148325CF|nr:uncharacterized protein LOC117625599 [Prunus dulcis]